jgi:hypothetical protein
MTEEIIRKLTDELNKGITSEAQVVYLMAGIRKLIERDELGEDYSVLKFHCDWVLHSKLEGRAAREVLHLFDKAEDIKRKNGIPFEELPADIRRRIDRVSKLDYFETEMASFLERYKLPPLTVHRSDGWPYFVHLYTRVVQDIPLVIAGPRTQVHREPVPPPKYIMQVAVECEMAIKPYEGAGLKEMFYRIWWKLRMNDKDPEAFYIMNSFSVKGDELPQVSEQQTPDSQPD